MAYDLAKVTANGNNLIAQILANKSSLSVDKIEISDTQLPSTTDISTMTSVPKVVQTVSANGFSKNSNTLIISTVVDNSSISADYKAWVFGIWGSDSQNGQSQLIAVITSTNSPDTIPAFSGSTPVSYTYKFNIGFSNASQIQFNMIDDSFATNDTVVHTTGDETIDGQKKFKTDPTDGAGNAYAKTVDVNQQLDKKVNIADMRKPASDVAGIEEVNAKQDAIGYTPADDSKVVHDNHDNTITANNLIYDLSKTGITPIGFCASGSFNDLPLGTVMTNAPTMTDGPDKIHAFTTTTLYFNSWGGRRAQIAIVDVENLMYFRVCQGSNWNSWTLLSDDSKVAHLSGANNFDTVPTVNNNPLLLASSLPSDLARTGQDQEFTGKNTFDTAPIDKTTGNPYITKDGVPSIPSDLARTGQAQTFTAAQTFSIAPVINDASTDKGDNQAATMADLKSVEESAWRVLDQSNAPINISFRGQVLYKIDDAKKIIYFTTNGPMTDARSGSHLNLIDFKGIVNNLLSGNGRLVSVARKTYIDDSTISVTSTYVQNSDMLNYQTDTNVNLVSYGEPDQNYAYVTYDSLVNN
ncbi:hypothetical protein LBSP_21000 [Lentilactobacillus buchneri subsp. silagei]|uniref:hypothetical protein n=1 Tax=Lentilactobacillus buchneri TaxID=1581 RepID=UPI0012E62440|nr:hypothetical protein [Lentilactobacillus buchneri]GED95540.1 hypothetical protein LBSP_21000 [Lentilactobacillus buchneri subsp. silagei]